MLRADAPSNALRWRLSSAGDEFGSPVMSNISSPAARRRHRRTELITCRTRPPAEPVIRGALAAGQAAVTAPRRRRVPTPTAPLRS